MANLTIISVFHFSRTFKEVVGETPHAYVSIVRLKKASHLLYSTECPISEIAETVGMSESQFFRSFLAAYQVSPRHYRKQFRHKNSLM